MQINSKKTIVFLLVLVFLVSGAIYFYLVKNFPLEKQIEKQPEKVGHEPCLSHDEIVEYRIEKQKDTSSNAIVSIREKDTKKQIFQFQIENIVPGHYHPYEAHKCGIDEVGILANEVSRIARVI